MSDSPEYAYTVTIHNEFGEMIGDPIGPVILNIHPSGALLLIKPDQSLDTIYSKWASVQVRSTHKIEKAS